MSIYIHYLWDILHQLLTQRKAAMEGYRLINEYSGLWKISIAIALHIYSIFFSKPGDTFLSGFRHVLSCLVLPGLASSCFVWVFGNFQHNGGGLMFKYSTYRSEYIYRYEGMCSSIWAIEEYQNNADILTENFIMTLVCIIGHRMDTFFRTKPLPYH